MKRLSAASRISLAGVAVLLGLAVSALGSASHGAASAGSEAASKPAGLLATFAAPPQEEAGQSGSAGTAHEAAPGAEHAPEHGAEHAEGHGLLSEIFHIFNLLVLLTGVWLLIKKFLVPFLEERGRLIREDMDRSAKALAEADQRLAAIEEKMKGMDAEMAALRQNAFRESAAERERIIQAAQADASKILASAEMEIAAAVKVAKQELKAYTAELAVELAEKQIQESLTPSSEERLLRVFIKELSASDGSASGRRGATAAERKE